MNENFGQIYRLAAGKRLLKLEDFVESVPELTLETETIIAEVIGRFPVQTLMPAPTYSAIVGTDKLLFDNAVALILAAKTRRMKQAAENDGKGAVVESKIGDNDKRYAGAVSGNAIQKTEDDWIKEADVLIASLSYFKPPVEVPACPPVTLFGGVKTGWGWG